MEKLAILDCGGQYTKVIDRRVRELGVKSDILPINASIEKLRNYKAIILSGGPNSVWSDEALEFENNLFDLGKPILGICYGMQLICEAFGGVVSPRVKKEYGECVIEVDLETPLFSGLKCSFQKVLMSHGDTIKTIPENFSIVATSDGAVAAIANMKKKIYGVQFHPEVDLTEQGIFILKNFLRKISDFKENYNLEDRITKSIEYIRKKIGNRNVIVLVSGGVDSAVSAALLLKALPKERVYAIHIDSGLMRKNESDEICESLRSLGLLHMYRENAKDFFFNTVIEFHNKKLGPLVSLVDPEEKRNLIGELFVRVVYHVANRLGLDLDNTCIAQGTLRPDLIESGNPDVSSYAKTIKTHHNDVDIIRKAREKGLIVETNWDWHKDEVRRVAVMLGIDEKIAYRQPFPGPGLGVRILCHEEDSVIDVIDVKRLNAITSDSYGKIIPIRSVGVQGDIRSYKNLCLLWGDNIAFEWDKTYEIAKKITNEVTSVNRVGYILNSNSPGVIKTRKMHINDENVMLLQEIDSIVTKKLTKGISQAFAILLPIGITKKYSIAIRTFITNDFMTGRPAFIGSEVERQLLTEIVDEILQKFGDQIEFVIYDITSKPPATCEWQ